ncbi:uncharacterized protein LOC124799326 [Schistocerca piceifrons]|uniref:uncharacterized protein LOC124799326 n=1 Tax=Schistocerca piceifrons TaxID=274613 RepID=UPI001F5FABA0|nr:uncharacterized protein LOC124799326 [Schistocerca piceifrons]
MGLTKIWTIILLFCMASSYDAAPVNEGDVNTAQNQPESVDTRSGTDESTATAQGSVTNGKSRDATHVYIPGDGFGVASLERITDGGKEQTEVEAEEQPSPEETMKTAAAIIFPPLFNNAGPSENGSQ